MDRVEKQLGRYQIQFHFSPNILVVRSLSCVDDRNFRFSHVLAFCFFVLMMSYAHEIADCLSCTTTKTKNRPELFAISPPFGKYLTSSNLA